MGGGDLNCAASSDVTDEPEHNAESDRAHQKLLKGCASVRDGSHPLNAFNLHESHEAEHHAAALPRTEQDEPHVDEDLVLVQL